MKKLLMVMLFFSSISTTVLAEEPATPAPVDATESTVLKDCGDGNQGPRDVNPGVATDDAVDTTVAPAADTVGQ